MGAILKYPTSIAAWEGINETLISDPEYVVKKGGYHNNIQVLLFDVTLLIARSYIPDDFNFGIFNYRMQKWNSLKNNYLDMNQLDKVKSRVMVYLLKKATNYNVSMHFTDKHDNGKGCLLSCTFSKRYNDDQPELAVHVRASEVTKRLIFDLLLIHRIGEYVYGEGASFGIRLTIVQSYIDGMSFLMMHNYKDLFKWFDKDDWNGRTLKLLKSKFDQYYNHEDPEGITFGVYRRIAVSLSKGKKGELNELYTNTLKL